MTVDALGWIGPALARLESAGLRRTLRHRTGGRDSGPRDFSGNDYLDLAGDPRLAAAAGDAARRWGSGTGGSRLVTGSLALHAELEAALARWKQADDAVLFSSGYLANTGTIAALVGAGDLVVSDEWNHASIIDGCRLSGAEVAVFRHGDVTHAAELLQQGARPGRRLLVVVDGVFSMDGDAADLPELCGAAEAVGAMVMVDDAHASGVLGPDGRGTPAAQGVQGRVHVHVGTLSKAVGAAGGFVAGRHDLVEWLRNRARSFVFDTAPSPAVMGAALEGLRVLQAEPGRRDRALAAARQLATGLGLAEPAACIVPLVLGDPAAAVQASAHLESAGFRVVAIRPPSVPEGTARLRFTTNAGHDEATVEALIEAVRRVAPAGVR